MASTLALTASFLSAFNGALLAAVHVGLVVQRHLRPVRREQPRFHWLMVSALLVIFFLFAALRSLDNPYLLANLLLGPYAIAAAVLAGTRGLLDPLPEGSLLWIAVASVVVWCVYFVSTTGLPSLPTTYQINTVPGGVFLFAGVLLACRTIIAMAARRVRS
jgi:hypothetical protein